MNSKYNCEKCNYLTNKLSSYKKHLVTKKHTGEERKIPIKKVGCNNNENKQFTCKYCNNVYSDKSNKSKHYGICKQKQKYEKNKLCKQMERENALEENKKLHNHINKLEADKQKLEADKQKLEADKQKLEEEKKVIESDKQEAYNDYISVLKTVGPKNIQNNSFTVKNTQYILNNYKHAHNLEDLLEPALTEEEIERMQKRGPIYACVRLLDDRCISNVELSERPFHCVDTSRSKYIVFTENEWRIDERGQKILNQVYPIIRPVFPMQKDGVYIPDNINGLIEMENNPSKILKYIEEPSSHSANVINDKKKSKKKSKGQSNDSDGYLHYVIYTDSADATDSADTEDEPVTDTEDEPITDTEDEPITDSADTADTADTEDEPITDSADTEDESVTDTIDSDNSDTTDELMLNRCDEILGKTKRKNKRVNQKYKQLVNKKINPN
jgi:hypothetical protein